MRKKHGFTLVELLVVMAIISILAAIAIPNIQRWILKGRAVRAMSEIENIQTSITKILSDAGRSSLTELMNFSVIENDIGAPLNTWTDVEFDQAVDIYTRITYVLLRKGRAAITDADNLNDGTNDLLKEDVVRNLGTSYMSDLGFDPWGKLYRIYPGPWSTSQLGTIPFRVYLPSVAGGATLPGDDVAVAAGDELTIYGTISGDANAIDLFDPDTGDDMEMIGIPANDRTEVFVWSYGANGLNGQALFQHPDIGPYDPTLADGNYDGTLQEPELLGGGDDINNWDRDQTFMRFYN